jgi:hypothetical protein
MEQRLDRIENKIDAINASLNAFMVEVEHRVTTVETKTLLAGAGVAVVCTAIVNVVIDLLVK